MLSFSGFKVQAADIWPAHAQNTSLVSHGGLQVNVVSTLVVICVFSYLTQYDCVTFYSYLETVR